MLKRGEASGAGGRSEPRTRAGAPDASGGQGRPPDPRAADHSASDADLWKKGRRIPDCTRPAADGSGASSGRRGSPFDVGVGARRRLASNPLRRAIARPCGRRAYPPDRAPRFTARRDRRLQDITIASLRGTLPVGRAGRHLAIYRAPVFQEDRISHDDALTSHAEFCFYY